MIYVAETCRPSRLANNRNMVWCDIESLTLDGLKTKLKKLGPEYQVIRVFIRRKIEYAQAEIHASRAPRSICYGSGMVLGNTFAILIRDP